MAFDLKSAKIVSDEETKTSPKPKFDLMSAKVVKADESAGKQIDTGAVEESFGKKVGRTIAGAPRALFEAAKDFGEAGITMASGAAATVSADLLGIARAAEPVFARTFMPKAEQYIKAIPETPSETRARVLAEETHQPKREGTKAVLGAAETLATPITATARFAGDVVEGATGSKFVGDVANDIAAAAVGYGAGKVVPKVVSKTAEATKAVSSKVAETGKKAVTAVKEVKDIASEFYTPERQMIAAGAHLASGDIIGAATQAGIATARKAYAAKKSQSPAVADVVSENYGPRVTTRAEGEAIRDIVAERRAEAAARNAASGKNIRSTVNDTAAVVDEVPAVVEAPAVPVVAPKSKLQEFKEATQVKKTAPVVEEVAPVAPVAKAEAPGVAEIVAKVDSPTVAALKAKAAEAKLKKATAPEAPKIDAKAEAKAIRENLDVLKEGEVETAGLRITPEVAKELSTAELLDLKTAAEKGTKHFKNTKYSPAISMREAHNISSSSAAVGDVGAYQAARSSPLGPGGKKAVLQNLDDAKKTLDAEIQARAVETPKDVASIVAEKPVKAKKVPVKKMKTPEAVTRPWTIEDFPQTRKDYAEGPYGPDIRSKAAAGLEPYLESSSFDEYLKAWDSPHYRIKGITNGELAQQRGFSKPKSKAEFQKMVDEASSKEKNLWDEQAASEAARMPYDTAASSWHMENFPVEKTPMYDHQLAKALIGSEKIHQLGPDYGKEGASFESAYESYLYSIKRNYNSKDIGREAAKKIYDSIDAEAAFKKYSSEDYE